MHKLTTREWEILSDWVPKMTNLNYVLTKFHNYESEQISSEI